MLRVSLAERESRCVWIPLLTLSVAAHGLLLHLGRSSEPRAVPRYQVSVVRLERRAASAPRPRAETPPPRAEPPAQPTPAPAAERSRAAGRPRPAAKKPAPTKPVFGVSRGSVVGGESGVAVRLGDSLETTMDREVRLPAWARGAQPEPPPRPAAAPRARSEAALRPVPLYQLTETPRFRRKVEPRYPSRPRQLGIEGVVLLQVLIDAQGSVREVRVLTSPDEELSSAAVTALRESTLSPGMVQGRAVPVWLKIPYRFVLDS